jgi:hypothetical protein
MAKFCCILAFVFVVGVGWGEEPYTPENGSAARAQISDAVWRIRPEDNNYRVTFLVVQGDWAIFDAGRPGGDGAIAATLQRVNGKWTVLQSFWHDDVPKGDEFRDHGKLQNLPDGLCQIWDKQHSHH